MAAANLKGKCPYSKLMLSQDCLDHMQVSGKSCPFTVPAPIYEIPELVQQYET